MQLQLRTCCPKPFSQIDSALRTDWPRQEPCFFQFCNASSPLCRVLLIITTGPSLLVPCGFYISLYISFCFVFLSLFVFQLPLPLTWQPKQTPTHPQTPSHPKMIHPVEKLVLFRDCPHCKGTGKAMNGTGSGKCSACRGTGSK